LNGWNGEITGCRIRCTYADAINLNLGASNDIVDNNHVRGCGDDGLAILADASTSYISTNDKVLNNTVIATWWGHNCDLAGGNGHVISYNYLADNAKMAAFTVNLPSGYAMHPLTGATVSANTIVRGGGNFAGQQRGAIWLYSDSTAISNLYIQDNYIYAPIFRGIHVHGSVSQSEEFDRNAIVSPGVDAIVIDNGPTGSGTFNSNTVTGLGINPATGLAYSAFVNNNSSGYTCTLTGNNW
jgi:hypothetical protein